MPPDEAGDSATFLSFFLPNEDTARRVFAELNQAGVDGCFYYYDNNWHYLRCWHHLKQMKCAARSPAQLSDHLPDYAGISLPKSDGIIARNISMQIKLGWTQSDLEERIAKIEAISKNL